MVGVKVKTQDQTKKVAAKAKQAAVKNLGHAGAAIRLTAKRSIRKSKTESPEGTPPHTRKGQLRGAIAYAVEKKDQAARRRAIAQTAATCALP